MSAHIFATEAFFFEILSAHIFTIELFGGPRVTRVFSRQNYNRQDLSRIHKMDYKLKKNVFSKFDQNLQLFELDQNAGYD